MTKPKAARAIGVHALADYTSSEALAIKALIAGTAEPHQQQLAMRWIIEQASFMYGCHFQPTDRDTSFALGRAFVGQQIVGISKLNLASLRRDGQ